MLLNKTCFYSEILHAYAAVEHANAVLEHACAVLEHTYAVLEYAYSNVEHVYSVQKHVVVVLEHFYAVLEQGVLLTGTCLYLDDQVFAGVSNQDMLLCNLDVFVLTTTLPADLFGVT